MNNKIPSFTGFTSAFTFHADEIDDLTNGWRIEEHTITGLIDHEIPIGKAQVHIITAAIADEKGIERVFENYDSRLYPIYEALEHDIRNIIADGGIIVWLKDLSVNAEYRGYKFGSSYMNALAKYAQQLDNGKLSLIVTEAGVINQDPLNGVSREEHEAKLAQVVNFYKSQAFIQHESGVMSKLV